MVNQKNFFTIFCEELMWRGFYVLLTIILCAIVSYTYFDSLVYTVIKPLFDSAFFNENLEMGIPNNQVSHTNGYSSSSTDILSTKTSIKVDS